MYILALSPCGKRQNLYTDAYRKTVGTDAGWRAAKVEGTGGIHAAHESVCSILYAHGDRPRNGTVKKGRAFSGWGRGETLEKNVAAAERCSGKRKAARKTVVQRGMAFLG